MGRKRLYPLAAAVFLLLSGIIFWQGPYQTQRQVIVSRQTVLQQKKEQVLSVENFLNAHGEAVAYEAEIARRAAKQHQQLPCQLETGKFLAELQQLAAAKGVVLSAAAPGTVESKAGCRQLPLRVTIAGDYFSLLDFLQGLEELERFSSVDKMELHSEEGRLSCQLLIHIYGRSST